MWGAVLVPSILRGDVVEHAKANQPTVRTGTAASAPSGLGSGTGGWGMHWQHTACKMVWGPGLGLQQLQHFADHVGLHDELLHPVGMGGDAERQKVQDMVLGGDLVRLGVQYRVRQHLDNTGRAPIE